jgi:replication factor C subunit 1
LAAAKKEAEEKKILDMAREMEVRAKQQQQQQAAKKAVSGVSEVVDSQLWTEKYAPTAIKDVIGNKGLVEKLQRWLRDWCVHYDLLC